MVGTREVKIEAVIERVRRNRCWSPGPPKAPPPSSLEPHRLNQEGKLLPNCSWRHIFSHYHTRNHHQRNSSNAGHHANFWKRSAWLHGQVLVEVLTGPHVWRHCSGVEKFARSQKKGRRLTCHVPELTISFVWQGWTYVLYSPPASIYTHFIIN